MASPAAAIMRRIATASPCRAHAAKLPTRRTHLCGPCAVSWTGDERDCWSCGNPATQPASSPEAALQTLLTSCNPLVVTCK